MKAHLLYRDRDFDWRWALEATAIRDAARSGRRYQSQGFDWQKGLPWNAAALEADLGLGPVLDAMAHGDDGVFVVSRKVLLADAGDLDTIRYRQAILQDCLDHADVVRELYATAVEANEKRKGSYLGMLVRYPDSVLRDALETMETLLVFMKRLRAIADRHGGEFAAEGWVEFFTMLRRDLDDPYFASVQSHLQVLRFRDGELVSAEIGTANKGNRYLLHRTPHRRSSLRDWWLGLFAQQPPDAFRFELAPRDEAGAQALQGLRNRGIALAANALGQAADHVRDFFSMLRTELAFYIGCVNLHESLTRKGEPVSMPAPTPACERLLSCQGLYDVALALTVDRNVVGNDADADGKSLVVITGRNSGGKSTFLRGVGLALLMMQCGLFVGATSFRASLCDGIFTHFKREEDAAMDSGKFDEELSRMSGIVDHVGKDAVVLFNESFAATNEREGSEIARQVMTALMDSGVRVLCVTHMYELARGFFERDGERGLFLRAGRDADGARTFKLCSGEPLPMSFGEDLYRNIFGISPESLGEQEYAPVRSDK
jgi:MutS domain V